MACKEKTDLVIDLFPDQKTTWLLRTDATKLNAFPSPAQKLKLISHSCELPHKSNFSL